MTPRKLALAAAAAALATLLAGCETTKLAEPGKGAAVETRTPTPTASAGAPAATSSGTPQSSVTTVDLSKENSRGAPDDGPPLPSQHVVYFDFDSYVIKDDYQPVIDGYAKVLQANRSRKLVVEGHTDERGGREYNLALGQKRAAAVVKSLTLLGASDSQLEAVSFGEERPAVVGNDESAWSKNRRAELKDR